MTFENSTRKWMLRVSKLEETQDPVKSRQPFKLRHPVQKITKPYWDILFSNAPGDHTDDHYKITFKMGASPNYELIKYEPFGRAIFGSTMGVLKDALL